MSTDIKQIIETWISRHPYVLHPERAAANLLAALSAAGVVLVADLPEVTVDGDGHVTAGEVIRYAAPADLASRISLGWLAIARHLEQQPDPADVDALAAIVGRTRLSTDCKAVARALLASGKVTVQR